MPGENRADRMAESLRRAVAQFQSLGIEQWLLDAMPDGAQTLHRLLGVIPDVPRFRHDADNPLPYDIVVVDEASMVDLPLMCKLAEAVADGAQLILLGDADQLPSVEAGDVLTAILPDTVLADASAAGLSAVIEEKDGTKSYWALAHGGGAPDFHAPACFALPLAAPERA